MTLSPKIGDVGINITCTWHFRDLQQVQMPVYIAPPPPPDF